jgi:signal transduction histidine kinase
MAALATMLPLAQRMARWAPQSLQHRLFLCFAAGVAVLAAVVLLAWPAPVPAGTVLLLAGTALAVALAMRWGIEQLVRPIRELAAAIDRHGTDLREGPLAERGPVEAQAMAHALNRMRGRIADLLADQTRMLAAISHDLRTPATRLRLRAEFVREEQLRSLMLRDLDEMDAMLTEALAFLSHDAHVEPRKLVDLTALLQAVCDDYADVGRPVVFVEPPPLSFRSVPTLFAAAGQEHRFEHERRIRLLCRPAALRRAVTNLIDNALKYGFRAEVRLDADAQHVRVSVGDQGPGIPEAELDKVMLPFYRIESSRQRSTGGMGLGLAIVKAVADAHRGGIELANREQGGLLATMQLPRET